MIQIIIIHLHLPDGTFLSELYAPGWFDEETVNMKNPTELFIPQRTYLQNLDKIQIINLNIIVKFNFGKTKFKFNLVKLNTDIKYLKF